MELNPSQKQELERLHSLIANTEATETDLRVRDSVQSQVETAYKNYFRVVEQQRDEGYEPVEQSRTESIARMLYTTCAAKEAREATKTSEAFPAIAERMEMVRMFVARAFAGEADMQHEIPRTIAHLLMMSDRIAEETGMDVSAVRSCLLGIARLNNLDPVQNLLNDEVLARFHEKVISQFYGAMLKKGYSIALVVPADLNTPAHEVRTEIPGREPSKITIIANHDQIEIVTELQDKEIEQHREVIDAATIIRQKYGDPHHAPTEYADKYDVHAQIDAMVREKFGVSIDDAGEGVNVAATSGTVNTPDSRFEQPQLSPDQLNEASRLRQIITQVEGDNDVRQFLLDRAQVAVDNYYFALGNKAAESSSPLNAPNTSTDAEEIPIEDKTRQMLHTLYTTAFIAEMEYFQQGGIPSKEQLANRLERIHQFLEHAAKKHLGKDAKVPRVIGHLAVISDQVAAQCHMNSQDINHVLSQLIDSTENPSVDALSADLYLKLQGLICQALNSVLRRQGVRSLIINEREQNAEESDSYIPDIRIVRKKDGRVEFLCDPALLQIDVIHDSAAMLDILGAIFTNFGA